MGSKKSVRFNEVVLRQVYRSNSSILGQKHKNQKKAEQKRRKAARRASEGDVPCDSESPFTPRYFFFLFVYFLFSFCLLFVYFLFTFCLLFVYFSFTFCLIFVYILFTFRLFSVYFSFTFCLFSFTFRLLFVYFSFLQKQILFFSDDSEDPLPENSTNFPRRDGA